MKLRNYVIFASAFSALSALAQAQLPPCPGSITATWTNCVGEIKFPGGESYVGEWRDNKRNGQGTRTWPGHKLVGEFRNDKANGKGIYTETNGERYVGEWRDDKRDGQGTQTLPGGWKYVGEFKDDKRHGQGTLTLRDGTKYVGEFKEGEPVHSKPVGSVPETTAPLQEDAKPETVVSEPPQLDLQRAFLGGLVELVIRFIVAMAVFFTLYIGVAGRQNDPVKNGRRVAAWLAAIAVVATPNQHKLWANLVVAILAMMVFWYVVGFVAGYAWRKLRPLKDSATEPSNLVPARNEQQVGAAVPSPATIHDAVGTEPSEDARYEQALDELNSGQTA